MEWQYQLFLLLGLLFGMLLGGMWLPFAIGISGLLAILFHDGVSGLNVLGYIAWGSLNSATLTAIPLFILMSEILMHSGVTTPLYEALARLVRRLPGGLLHTNIMASSVFASICGSSVATAAAIGTVALPQLASRGYSKNMSYGSLVAGGTLGILIPPSIPLIIYGSFTETSVARLFMAGLVPGLVLACLFMLFIGICCACMPSLSGEKDRTPKVSVFRTLRDLIPFFCLMIAILGSIYFGVATPTEAAALGCILALPIAMISGNLTFRMLALATTNAVKTSCGLLLIILGAMVFSYAFENAGLGTEIAKWVVSLNLDRSMFLICLFLIYGVLGCLIESVSMIVITVPLIFPVVLQYGIDSIWFGIFLVIMIELGQMTPPFGINLFVIQGVAKAPLGKVVSGVIPYYGIIALFVLFIAIWPEIVLWLPSRMFGH